MNKLDKLILNYIQSNFPMIERPYLKIAEQIETTEKDVIERIFLLKETGMIRRIGGNFVPDRLGFVSTLCAARVSEKKIKKFIKKVNSFLGVTHNYRRTHEYNIWFTFIASSHEDIETNLEEIKRETGVSFILNLPAYKVFKIKAEFNL